MAGWKYMVWTSTFDLKSSVIPYEYNMLLIIFIILDSCCVIGTVSWVTSCWPCTWTVLFPWWSITSCWSGLLYGSWRPSRVLRWLGLVIFLTAITAGMWGWSFRLNNPVYLRRRLSRCRLSLWWAVIGLWRWCRLWMSRNSVCLWCLRFSRIRLDWPRRSGSWSRGRRSSWPVRWSLLLCSVSWLWWRRWGYLSWWGTRSLWCLCWIRLNWSSGCLFLRWANGVTDDVTIWIIPLRIARCVVWTIIIYRLKKNYKALE